MKTLKYILPALFIITLSSTACNKDDDNTDTTPTTPVATLTAEEKEDLLLMREEEKLARDVYLYSFDLHGLQVFSNISNSEQTHMDKILELLNYYGIADPASPDRGVFNNPKLQTLYNDLIALSDKSLLDALIVGATIEDLDIYDLDHSLTRTNKTDIITVYNNLNCGSRNHMRSYSGQIDGNGGNYSAQFISEQQYLEILSGDHEKCGPQ